jgi:hypothetical protein
MRNLWEAVRSYELEKLVIFLAIVLWPWYSQWL